MTFGGLFRLESKIKSDLFLYFAQIALSLHQFEINDEKSTIIESVFHLFGMLLWTNDVVIIWFE